ncbi:prenyltransferase/squalene oxidase repeat-containing protein [Novipirellula artificiosorum]|uniref:Prenyltransferase and squalene oxidase repeat protein n=1 Tax=Novipirellula artificiosorum TaxID=2528016 RepID=A0A5C6DDP8_9BACT|nr:prenyltransferase/squalene oxidase repeat-containing protein [Novipirellula artificiosorum]TWU33907.1 Prenyltransferase and squalene oxidase repeat protein [Novipirellula artificiosorum]
MIDQSGARLSRRVALQSLAFAGCVGVTGGRLNAAESGFRDYLMGLRKPDGGFGWSDQPGSHLVATHAVVGCCVALQIELTDVEMLAEFVRREHPAAFKPPKQHYREFDLQQIETLQWLGQDVSAFHAKAVRWKAPIPYANQYEKHAYPIFCKQIATLLCRDKLNLSWDDLNEPMRVYVAQRRRPNGSFNNTPSDDGSDGHVVATWWGLQAASLFGQVSELRERLVPWLQACQQNDGGFTWQPNPSMSARSTVTYTRAALRSLQLFNAKPLDQQAAATFLRSLKNPDDGFAERPGWLSNPLSTYHAVDALASLEIAAEADRLRLQRTQTSGATQAVPLPQKLRVFSAQIQSHGTGSPRDAVLLAQRLGIHLWGAKNAKPEWIAAAQRIADQDGVAVQFAVANEDYGTWIEVPGEGTYSHMSDIMAENASAAEGALTRGKVLTWDEYRKKRLQPLEKAGGRLIWQFGENEDLVRLLLDDSLDRGGFAAISTFHFGNPDFTDTEPFLHLYRGQIPFVALQDAHGPQPWWFADMTTGFRTLFLAEEPSWDGWLKALQYNWTIAVRRDARTDNQLIMHSASQSLSDYVIQRQEQWSWWLEGENSRPMSSLVAIGPDDTFETGCPAKGIAIRVRCAWSNTGQGLLKEPLSKLLSLTVDGQVVPTREIRSQSKNGKWNDIHDLYEMPEGVRGQHQAEARVHVLSTGEQIIESIRF